MCASHCWGITCPSAPTASRATRTHACSKILALRANKPVLGHANAWSPKASTCAPHPGEGPQRRELRCSGRRKRRRSTSCMACDCRVVAGSMGTAVSQAPACGPACERTSALALGGKVGRNTRSRKCRLRIRDAWDCQPCGQSPKLVSRRRGERAPSRTARHSGHACQRAPGSLIGAPLLRASPRRTQRRPGGAGGGLAERQPTPPSKQPAPFSGRKPIRGPRAMLGAQPRLAHLLSHSARARQGERPRCPK